MAAADLEWLHGTAHLVPRRVEELARIHRTRVSELVGQSKSQIRTIAALFLVFLGLGLALVAFVSVSLNREIALPLRSLAAAARAIAEGRLDARVPIPSRDEIGQLSADFNHMAERLQSHERSLDEAKRDLQQKAREAATLQERERLAREMHDGFAQSLALLTLKLRTALMLPQVPPALASLLGEMSEVTLQAYQDVRQSIFGLRTFVSRGLGFEAALAEYLHEFAEQNRMTIDLDMADGASCRLPRDAELQLVRIIQEALVNVRKHAAATKVRVGIRSDGDRVRVAIEDDGVGWETLRGPDGPLHFGLAMMRERAEGLGGGLELESAPGRGTRVLAWIPKEQQ
jgi:nitrate/nitrite-specific signal transduction histidine kinase